MIEGVYSYKSPLNISSSSELQLASHNRGPSEFARNERKFFTSNLFPQQIFHYFTNGGENNSFLLFS